MAKEIIYKIKIEGGERSQQTIDEVQKELDQLEKELKEATAGTERFINAQKRLATLQNALRQSGLAWRNELHRANDAQAQAAQAAQTASNGMQGLGQAFNFAKGAAAAFIGLEIVGQLKEQADKALQLAGAYENTKIAFETFVGGAGKANAVLAQLNKFSIETPFTSEEVIRAGQQFLAIGTPISDTMKLLKQLGNIAAGANVPFNELVTIVAKFKTQGRLYQEDVNQLAERGIAIYPVLAKVLGRAESEVRKLVEAGKVGFPEVSKALAMLTEQGGLYFNLIEKQSKTFPGLMSTLSGAWDDFLRKVAESKLLEPAKAGVRGLISVVEQLNDAIDPTAKPNIAAVEEMKKALGLENLSDLTADQLAQRRELINMSITEDEKYIQALEANLRTADERRAAAEEILADKIQKMRLDDNMDAVEKHKIVAEERARIDSEYSKESLAAQISMEKAKLDAKKIALDDIAKLDTEAAKQAEAKRISEREDILKLQIFRRELELETLKAISDTESMAGVLRTKSVEKVIDKEKELAKLRRQLADISAQNDAQKALNREKEAENLKKAAFDASKDYTKNIEAIGGALRKDLLKNLKLIELPKDLPRDLQDAAKKFVPINEQAQRAKILLDEVFGEKGTIAQFEKYAPAVFDMIGSLFDAQAAQLDRLVELQEKRVEDAQAIAEKGNAAQLAEERKRLAALQAEQEKASKRSQTLAQIETRIQIGLAVAKAAAAAAGTTVGALAIGAAVAVGIPAIINNLPMFEDGGMVGGKPHSAGGTPLIAEKGEYIVNRQSTASFLPAIERINAGAADPALVNAAARGDIANYFNMQLAPLTSRLENIEQAVRSQPGAQFLVDENGWAVRQSRLSAKSQRITKIIG